MNWAASLIENRDPCLTNYQSFVSKLKAFYENDDSVYTANQMLRTLKQHHLGGVRGYILEFNKFADDSNWNEEAKMDAFICRTQNGSSHEDIRNVPRTKGLTFCKEFYSNRLQIT